jgi:hypothetical protein
MISNCSIPPVLQIAWGDLRSLARSLEDFSRLAFNESQHPVVQVFALPKPTDQNQPLGANVSSRVVKRSLWAYSYRRRLSRALFDALDLSVDHLVNFWHDRIEDGLQLGPVPAVESHVGSTSGSTDLPRKDYVAPAHHLHRRPDKIKGPDSPTLDKLLLGAVLPGIHQPSPLVLGDLRYIFLANLASQQILECLIKEDCTAQGPFARLY